MKRLVDTGDLAEGQYKELLHLFRREGIVVHETHTHFMDYGAYWVADDDFSRAQEILKKEAIVYAARAREKWERQWRTEHKGSAMRWFAHRLFRSPVGIVTRLFFLVLIVSAFVIYPLWHAIRAPI